LRRELLTVLQTSQSRTQEYASCLGELERERDALSRELEEERQLRRACEEEREALSQRLEEERQLRRACEQALPPRASASSSRGPSEEAPQPHAGAASSSRRPSNEAPEEEEEEPADRPEMPPAQRSWRLCLEEELAAARRELHRLESAGSGSATDAHGEGVEAAAPPSWLPEPVLRPPSAASPASPEEMQSACTGPLEELCDEFRLQVRELVASSRPSSAARAKEVASRRPSSTARAEEARSTPAEPEPGDEEEEEEDEDLPPVVATKSYRAEELLDGASEVDFGSSGSAVLEVSADAG